MLQSVKDIRKIKKELDACESELTQVRKKLTELSGMEQPMKRIQQLQCNVETESQYCILFENTLTNICRLYETNEKKLIDYSDFVGKIARRESFMNQNLKELYEIFNKVLL